MKDKDHVLPSEPSEPSEPSPPAKPGRWAKQNAYRKLQRQMREKIHKELTEEAIAKELAMAREKLVKEVQEECASLKHNLRATKAGLKEQKRHLDKRGKDLERKKVQLDKDHTVLKDKIVQDQKVLHDIMTKDLEVRDKKNQLELQRANLETLKEAQERTVTELTAKHEIVKAEQAKLEEAIKNNDKYVVVKEAEVQLDPDCPICMCPMEVQRAFVPCGHRFCSECAMDAYGRAYECPLCRIRANQPPVKLF